jgi:hydroxymethylglutaryl-CoA reductase
MIEKPRLKMTESELPGFYRLPIAERRSRVAQLAGLDRTQQQVLSGAQGLSTEQADQMVENALGVFGLPVGLCANLRINGRDRLVPMCVEEPSVVAAASHAAKLLRGGAGIRADVSDPLMIGQVQLLDVPDFAAAREAIMAARDELLSRANSNHPRLLAAGGGARDIELERLEPMSHDDPLGPMMIVHLIVDVRDAMGANAINTMCETLADRLAELSGGRACLRILSNLSDRRTVKVTGKVPISALGGKSSVSSESIARGIEEASVFAERDPYRAATHNKGIMNGVDAVLLAFGQDFRAVEAGAHAFASRNGRYTAMARWRRRGEYLVGEMEIPMAIGIVGGIAKVHPNVQVHMRVAEVESAAELAEVVAAVGLAQNLGALRALASEGIQHGHMRLHARNIATEAGATGDEVQKVASTIADQGSVNIRAARDVLARLRREAAA